MVAWRPMRRPGVAVSVAAALVAGRALRRRLGLDGARGAARRRRLGCARARRTCAAARRRGAAARRRSSRSAAWSRALGCLVGGAGPLLGRARPDARVRGVPGRRDPARRLRVERVPLGGRGSRRGARRRGRLGAGRQGDPGALPRRRPDGTAARSDRLLERARAGRRHRCSCSALQLAAAARSRAAARAGRARLRGDRRGTPRGVSRRRGCGGCSASRSGSGSAATGSRRRCSRSPPSCRPAPSRRGRSAVRPSSRTGTRAPTASPTAPGSACCCSPARVSSRSSRSR